MHQDLVNGFSKMVEAVKGDGRCKGGWHYGSVGRGMSDEYSDYDPVFLVSEAHFEGFARDVKKFVAHACDEIVISWAEDYNSEYFKNFCNLVSINGRLHQLDFFILNADRTDNWWCRQHLKGCTRENIFFDSTGEVGVLLERGLRTDNPAYNPERCFETYWFHIEMLIKYFKRNDVFKLIKNVDMLFHSHVDLLLSEYDSLDWGAWETKVKKCVPPDKQAHLLAYFTRGDCEAYARSIRQCMEFFDEDAAEIFAKKGIEYPARVVRLVADFFDREVNGTVRGK